MHKFWVVLVDDEIDDQPKRHHDQIVADEAYEWVRGSVEEVDAGETGSEVPAEEDPLVDPRDHLRVNGLHHDVIDPEPI